MLPHRPILEPLELTHQQYLVKLALSSDAPLRLGELTKMLHLDPATLSPIIKRLEQSGLIERIPVADDERTFSIAPTEAGRTLREQALSVPPAVVERLGLPVECLLALRDVLTTVIAALDDPNDRPRGQR